MVVASELEVPFLISHFAFYCCAVCRCHCNESESAAAYVQTRPLFYHGACRTAVQVEEALVSQLLASPDLMALIDDFYWEHHVNFEPMVSIWQDGASKSKSMNDSLLLFSALRRAGVRAHSWT